MKRKIAVEIVFEFVAGVYLTGIVVFLWGHPVAATLLLAVGIGFWVLKHQNKADVVTMLAAVLLGTPSEMIGYWDAHLSAHGVGAQCRYHRQDCQKLGSLA